jgi:DNA-binding transcriptional LysR family regulator
VALPDSCLSGHSDLKSSCEPGSLPDYQTDVLNIYAVYPTRKHLSAKVRLFVNFF